MFAIEAIKFNHDPNAATHDALNIRKNATQFIGVPEWRRFISVTPEDSRAAYAVAPTHGNTITIQVSMSSADLGVNSIEARVEHHVKARTVSFTGGTSGFLTFDLINPPVAHGRVGIWDLDWPWEYRHGPHQPWRQFDTTRHRIYVVLDLPSGPWQQQPYAAANSQLAWSDVLDYACHWARGAHAKDKAAAQVTKSVYNLGLGPNKIVTYDCPGGGSSHYSAGPFDCTQFIDRLHGGTGNGIYVNCSDCASILSTFANVLGCDLWQSRMGYGFALNALLAIGSNVWQPACGWSGFSYHEVAWEAACTANDDVFDACLEVNGNNPPTNPPYAPLLPQDLRFGNSGQLLYRDRLATPAGRPTCNPQPATTRQRRQVV